MKLFDPILKPEYVILFGVNLGYSLSEIYRYQPTYIEWLIINISGFEIDIDEFESLPNPTVPCDFPFYFIDKPSQSNRKNVGLIKSCEKFNVINFKFSMKAKVALSQKKNGSFRKPIQPVFEYSKTSIKTLFHDLKYYSLSK